MTCSTAEADPPGISLTGSGVTQTVRVLVEGETVGVGKVTFADSPKLARVRLNDMEEPANPLPVPCRDETVKSAVTVTIRLVRWTIELPLPVMMML